MSLSAALSVGLWISETGMEFLHQMVEIRVGVKMGSTRTAFGMARSGGAQFTAPKLNTGVAGAIG